MLKKIAFVLMFTLLLLGTNFLSYTFLPDNFLRYLTIGILFTVIFLTAQKVSPKVFPKQPKE